MELLKNLSKTKIAIIAGSTVASLILVGLLVFGLSKPNLVQLYGELSQEDTSLIIAKLQGLGKKFASDQDGKTILVQAEDLLQIRMQLAQEGLPSKAQIPGYELFDKNDLLGTSQFVNNLNEVRALEGELTRTINSLTEIEQSRVHLVLPKSEYFSRTGPAASASVFLKVQRNKELSNEQVRGIANLVLAAVPGLTLERISIVDQKGKTLKNHGEAETDQSKAAKDYKSSLEAKMKKDIEDLVAKFVGYGKVQASVVAELDLDKVVISEEDYDPDRQAIRSQRNSQENSNDTEMDTNVSVSTNLPNFLQKPQPRASKNYKKEDEIINYEISKKVTNRVIEWGAIKQLSVAVLVDGLYDQDKNSKKEIYLRDRSEEELRKIKQLVAAAIGLDEARGDKLEVMNLPFVKEEFFESSNPNQSEQDLAGLIQFFIVLAVLLGTAFFFFRPNLKKIFNKEDTNNMANDLPKSLSSQLKEEEDKNNYKKPFLDKPYDELIKYVNDLTEEDPEEAAYVIRQWLQQNQNS
jgi:flagellar M-ring protein FliF